MSPLSYWQRIEFPNLDRQYRTPRVIDETIALRDYTGRLRQLVITDLGHEEPTLLLTNQLKLSPAKLITRYAQRMVIENSISDGIDFSPACERLPSLRLGSVVRTKDQETAAGARAIGTLRG